MGETLKDIGRTSHRAGIEGAKIGAVVGGSISLLTNLFDVALEKKQLGEAAQDLAIDTVQAAALGYGTAFVGAAIKGGLQQSGSHTLRTLSKTNNCSARSLSPFNSSLSARRRRPLARLRQ